MVIAPSPFRHRVKSLESVPVTAAEPAPEPKAPERKLNPPSVPPSPLRPQSATTHEPPEPPKRPDKPQKQLNLFPTKPTMLKPPAPEEAPMTQGPSPMPKGTGEASRQAVNALKKINVPDVDKFTRAVYNGTKTVDVLPVNIPKAKLNVPPVDGEQVEFTGPDGQPIVIGTVEPGQSEVARNNPGTPDGVDQDENTYFFRIRLRHGQKTDVSRKYLDRVYYSTKALPEGAPPGRGIADPPEPREEREAEAQVNKDIHAPPVPKRGRGRPFLGGRIVRRPLKPPEVPTGLKPMADAPAHEEVPAEPVAAPEEAPEPATRIVPEPEKEAPRKAEVASAPAAAAIPTEYDAADLKWVFYLSAEEAQKFERNTTALGIPKDEFYLAVDRRFREISVEKLADGLDQYSAEDQAAKEAATEAYAELSSGYREERIKWYEENRPQVKSLMEAEEFTDVTTLGGGYTTTQFVALSTPGLSGVFKPSSGEDAGRDADRSELRYGITTGTFWRREAVSYTIADMLGLGHLVPVTVTRNVAGDDGSLQYFFESGETATRYGQWVRYDGDEDAAIGAVFDYLIGNTDRHAGNWLYDERRKKIHLIDNGCTFPHTYESRDYVNVDLIEHAVSSGFNVPEQVKDWNGKWVAVQKALEQAGIEPEAIALTRQRWNNLMRVSLRGGEIGDLPAPWHPGMTLFKLQDV